MNKKEIKESQAKDKKSDESVKDTEEKVIRSESRQLMWFLIVIVILFLSFLLPYFYVINQRVFDFGGVTWQVQRHGDITLYHTQFSKVFMNNYYGEHNTFLRNDPRRNNIPFEGDGISIYSNVIISQSPEVLVCDKQILVTDALNQITLALPFIKQRTIAVSDKETAEQINRKYATCENKPDKSTIFQVGLGDETKVSVDEERGCFFITIKDCKDNLKAAERFIIEIIKELNKNN